LWRPGYAVDMDLTTAFVRSTADGTVDVVVNFGPLSGREATQAEVDRLARRVLTVAGDVRVHAVRTHDMGSDHETIVHQVVVEAEASADQADAVREICEDWALDCAEERSLSPLPL
jgi:hypothetical protein